MLKIKDNVDLKELEKFGFKKIEVNRIFFSDNYRAYERIHKEMIYECKISVHMEDSVQECRTIVIGGITKNYGSQRSVFDVNEMADILFDLIQAGLVEKVGDYEKRD